MRACAPLSHAAVSCEITQQSPLCLVRCPPSQVFTQCVWALATLAPGRNGPLFESLARSYTAKVRVSKLVSGCGLV